LQKRPETLQMLLLFTGVSKEQLATACHYYSRRPKIYEQMFCDDWQKAYKDYDAIVDGLRHDKSLREGVVKLLNCGHEWEEMPLKLERRKFNLPRKIGAWKKLEGEELFDRAADHLKGRFSDLRNEQYVNHVSYALYRKGVKHDKNPDIQNVKCNYQIFAEPNVLLRVTYQDTTSSGQDKNARNFAADAKELSGMKFALCVGGGGWERRSKSLRNMAKNADFVFGLNELSSFVDFVGEQEGLKLAAK